MRKQVLRILKGEVSGSNSSTRWSATYTEIDISCPATSTWRQAFRYQSGAVEGACKRVVKDRMEGSGMRWGAGADRVLKMLAIYLSGDFDEYGLFHLREEQQALWMIAASF